MFLSNYLYKRLLILLAIILALVALSSCLRQSHNQILVQNLSLQQFLQKTDVVNIQQYGSDQNGTRILGPGVSTLHKAENQKMFFLLKASNHFHHKPHSKSADFVVSMSVQNYTYEEQFDYIVDTGELGIGNDWCYVPVGFKAWMKTLAKPVHSNFQVNVINGVTVVSAKK